MRLLLFLTILIALTVSAQATPDAEMLYRRLIVLEAKAEDQQFCGVQLARLETGQEAFIKQLQFEFRIFEIVALVGGISIGYLLCWIAYRPRKRIVKEP